MSNVIVAVIVVVVVVVLVVVVLFCCCLCSVRGLVLTLKDNLGAYLSFQDVTETNTPYNLQTSIIGVPIPGVSGVGLFCCCL